MRCPVCAAFCDVPGDVSPFGVSAAPLPPLPPSLPAKGAADVKADEDDGQPYSLPPDPEPKEPCPNCRKSVPLGAIVCCHCGFNRDTGETLERLYHKVDKQWDGSLRLPARFGIFLAAGGLASAATVVVGLAGGAWIALFISLLIGVVLLAYVLGTYPRINLMRSRKGRATLTRTWRICFIPLPTADIRWRAFEGVVVGRSHEPDFWDWAILIFLLPFGLIPGVLWWFYVIHADQFDVALCKGHGFPELILYRGPSQAIAQEIAANVRDATGLRQHSHF
jgi:hypothetical protein